MAMKLTPDQQEQARQHLTGPQSAALIRFMAAQSVPALGLGADKDAIQTATNLGWLDAQTGLPTTIGFSISDSCREYLFWLERGRRLPFEGTLPFLTKPVFAGASVVEIGPGMGANLMSLADQSGVARGVEPVEIYAQLGAIFCALEGITPPVITPGFAEDLPLRDAEVDVVFCVSAHQYFDMLPALKEIARVTKPGGTLVIIGAALASFATQSIQAGGGYLPNGVTLVNTLGYMALGRRIVPSQGVSTTARPIYPTRRSMLRWLAAAGFEPITPPASIGAETCYHMRRLPDHTAQQRDH